MIKFRGKFTTTDLKEYRANPDLIYLPQIVYTDFSNPIKKCKECNCELLGGMEKKFTNKGYCSEWCRDESDEYKEKMISAKNHICKYPDCENDCRIIARKTIVNGKEYIVSSGVYSRYCEEHKGSTSRVYTKKEKVVNIKLQTKGFVCKNCKVYKTWDCYWNNKELNSKHDYTCKICSRKKQKEYRDRKKALSAPKLQSPDNKICKTCGIEKNISEFYGYHMTCKVCTSIIYKVKKQYESNN